MFQKLGKMQKIKMNARRKLLTSSKTSLKL